jgi:pimeloyl-ACP methyl ester carboxylesterase
MTGPVVIRHNRIDLALHELRSRPGRPLLHVHGLGERTPVAVPAYLARWPGPIWGLDLTGHGASGVPAGGGYFCEALMGDVDHALDHLGPATLVGRGLGAYVALLIAGARPDLVRGAILLDGPGLAGGGPEPGSPAVVTAVPASPERGTPDPFALAELAKDVRPPDYAATFARLSTTGSPLDTPLAVCGRNRPPWLEAVAAVPGVVECGLDQALDLFATSPG